MELRNNADFERLDLSRSERKRRHRSVKLRKNLEVKEFSKYLFMIILIISLTVPFVKGVGVIENRLGIKFNEESYQKKTFYAKGVYWMFYCDDDDDNAYFEASYDGVTWFGKTKVNQLLDAIVNKGWRLAVHYDENTDNIHYFITRYSNWGYYRMGVPQSDGTINWVKPETEINLGATRASHIITDSEGYPILAYNRFTNGGTQGPTIYYSSKKDGDLAEYERQRMLSSANLNWRIMSVPHTRPNLTVLYWQPTQVIRVRTFNGTYWTAEVTTTNVTSNYVSAVGIDNIVHIVYDYYDVDAKYDIWYVQFDYNTGLFNEPVKIAEDYVEFIAAAITKDNNNLVVTFADQNKVYYLSYNSEKREWGSVTEVYHESIKGIANNIYFSSYYQVYNNEVGVTWVATATSYDLTFISFTPIYPSYISMINTTLYNSDGTVNDGWIFEGEIYNFVSYVANTTTAIFSFSDTYHDLTFSFTNSTKVFELDTGAELVGGLIYTNVTYYVNKTMRLEWRFILNINIVDCENSSVDYELISINLNDTIKGTTGITFNIYNLGGFTYYTFTGDAGRITGGSPFELYATNGSLSSHARAEQIYRRLQHIHFLIEIDMDNEWEDGNGLFDIDAGVGWVDIGIDYRLNGSWRQGWYVKLYVSDADVGHHNAGIDHDWVEWAVDWYNYDPYTDLWQNIRSNLIYSNHWGYDNENLDPDYHNRTSSQLWVDLWFDRTNASTAIAGQVNSYYFGMREHGNSWWFGYGEFQPFFGEYENAKFLDDLYDERGNITNSVKFDLMRFYVEVGKVDIADGNDETWTIRAIESINRQEAADRMMGVEEPHFEETKVLDMPSFGWANPIVRAIQSIGTMIWMGALGFIKILWGAMDTLFEFAGLPKGTWSKIVEFILTIPNLMIKLIEYAAFMSENAMQLIEYMFSVIILVLPRLLWLMGKWIFTLISMIVEVISLFSGGWSNVGDIWSNYSIGEWIELLLIAFWPFWQLDRILNAKDPMAQIQLDINMYSSIFYGIYGFFVMTFGLIRNFVGIIIDLLPI